MFMLEAAVNPIVSAIGTLDFTQFSTTYTEVAKVMLPVIVTIVAVKKGYGWVKKGIKSL